MKYKLVQNRKKTPKSLSSGFTLIEVLVAMAIFTLVVSMSVGTLIVLIDANSKAQSMQAVMTNVSFALDSMTREIRTGYFYECRANDASLSTDNSPATKKCPSGQSNLAFTESDTSLTGGLSSRRIAYRLENNTIERRLADGDWQAVTAANVEIQELKFIVRHTERATDASPNYRTPTVTIFIKGRAGDIVGLEGMFSIQSSVAMQSLDI